MDKVITLINIGALKYDMTDSEVVALTATKNGYRLSSRNLLTIPGRLDSRRLELLKDGLAADLYILSNDPKFLNDYRTWATVIKETETGDYKVVKKDYFILRDFSDINQLRKIMTNAIPVYTTEDPITISFDETENSQKGYLIDRAQLELILGPGIEEIPFKEYFDVYTQNETGLIKTTFEDAFDVLKTNIEKDDNQMPKVNALRISESFYRLDLDDPKMTNVLSIFKPFAHQIVEFEDTKRVTEQGIPIWKSTHKVTMNESDVSFYERVNETGNLLFLEITPEDKEKIISKYPDKKNVILELLDTELEEYEIYDDPKGSKDMTYYISEQLVNNLNKPASSIKK